MTEEKLTPYSNFSLHTQMATFIISIKYKVAVGLIPKYLTLIIWNCWLHYKTYVWLRITNIQLVSDSADIYRDKSVKSKFWNKAQN